MEKHRKFLAIFLSFIFLCTVFCSGCINSPNDTNKPKSLVVGEMWRISSIDPGDGHGGGTFITEKAILTETLVSADSDFKLTPGLATDWKQINDTVWEFNLRKGVKFHNRKEMTASDVVQSLQRTVNASPSVRSLLDIDRFEEADKYKIRIVTKALNPLVPGVLHYPDTAIVSGDSYTSTGQFEKVIGTGPMIQDSFNMQTGEIVVKKNPDWWGGDVKLDKMIIRGYENPNTRALLAEKGDVDFTVDPPYSEVDRIAKLPGLRVEKYNTPRIYKMDVNLRREAMNDKNVRKAISHAIDRKGITENVLYGVGSPAGGVFLPSMVWANTSLKPYTYDPDLAREYLKKSGWTDTDGDGYVDKNKKKLKVKILTYTERPGLPPMLEALTDNLKNIGIEVEPISMENSALSPIVKSGDWDLNLAAWNLAMVPDPEYVLKGWYTTNGSANGAHYSNPEVDRLIVKGHSITDINERYDLFRKIEAVVYDDLPTINVAYYGVAVVMKDSVKGYKFDPTAHDYRIDPLMYIESNE